MSTRKRQSGREAGAPPPAISVRAVSKRYAGQPVVRDVTLDIEHGEFFSLLGPSGCGKTTLLRMIADFEQPDEGVITVAGMSPGGLPAYARGLNLVFQHYALFPHLTVAGNIGFGLEMQKVPATERVRRVTEMLELVDLAGFEQRMPRQLSGGQQQRVALARALITQPTVLLLDEPLGALDLKLRRAMQQELKTLQRQLGITFVYVTHDQEEALTMSDRIAVMHHGRVLQVGTPAQVYAAPATRVVAEFIGESNLLEGRARRRVKGALEVDWAGRIVRAGGTARSGEQVLLALRPERIALARRRPARAEHVYPVTVESAVYLGTDRRYEVRLEDGTRLQVREQEAGGAAFAEGERAWISWPAGAAVRVATDEGEGG